MRIGVPTEIKDNEYRVGMTPPGAAVLSGDGHEVYVQSGAGNGSGFSDEEYTAAGAKILGSADDVYAIADMIVKVKEPIDPDLERLRDGQLLFTYLHLAPVPNLTKALLDKHITGVAYDVAKSPAVCAAIRGGLVHGLVTHASLARSMLSASPSPHGP